MTTCCWRPRIRLGLQGGRRGIGDDTPRYGFVPAPAGSTTVTNAQIDALREAAGEG
jgi:hypothetical protein